MTSSADIVNSLSLYRIWKQELSRLAVYLQKFTRYVSFQEWKTLKAYTPCGFTGRKDILGTDECQPFGSR